ncbi:type VI secretion system baseplate subunit TssG [Pantoea sp. SO10]|uniref:type VI secretion system baseplate subunit TssG n=1 Tax=Pantoea sp. SO10 TaxID=2575375 RepID=UPI0010CA166B|nr:type VI secretion system baseplate subunit TssG [Pantoea sp. SO10]QCP58807.1 type VI secretion system baseplate subunit TssG [Pantoea sp. SO10]
MERESPLSYTELSETMGDRLPYSNFYRFMQWLEHRHPHLPPIGSTTQIKNDPIRLRPHAGMGFPASEFKGIELNPDENPDSPPTVRTTFLGLYGITSPLPGSYIDDIAKRREGHESVEHFLDIFNHRILTQFYRIWRKHNYPATFGAGGTDSVSQCLLSLAGLGISGTADHLRTPLSRFLSLPGILRQPGRAAEGLEALVRLVTPNTHATIAPNFKRRVEVPEPRLDRNFSLDNQPVLGGRAADVNSTVEIRLFTENPVDARGWLPPHQPLYHDLLSLLRVYLGWRYDAHITLTLPRRLFPPPRLSAKANDMHSTFAGYSFLPGQDDNNNSDTLTVPLGFYEGLTRNPQQRTVTEVDDD